MVMKQFSWRGGAYRALILDMDGTLVETERIMLETWDQVSREMGYVFSREVMLSTVGTTYNDTVRAMVAAYPTAPHDDIRTETSKRFRIIRESGGIALRPGAQLLLDTVAAIGAPVGLCTSTRRASAEITLASVGADKYFHSTVCGDEAPRGKPDPAPYLLAAERLGLDPADCLAVEDSPSGARSALAAGMTVAVVPDLIPVPAEVAARVTVLDGLGQLAAELSPI